MIPLPLDLTRLAELTCTQKARLPVSVAVDTTGSPMVISRYEDDVWNFWPYIPRENAKDGEKRIIWGIALPDGSRLTDLAHRSLLASAKDFIWSLHVDPIEGGKRPGLGTLISQMGNLAFLLRWMISQGINRFAQLDGRTLEYVVVVKDGKSAASTVMKRLLLIEKLFAQAGKIDDCLPSHPWPFESASLLAGVDQRMAHRVPKTPVIPELVFVQLAQKAIEYVDHRAPDILAIKAEAEQAMLAAAARGVKGHAYRHVFGTEVARAHGYEGLRELNAEMALLRTASYICINMFSGLRNSEMMSLESGCISREPGIDSSYECIWLHGTIYKTGERPHRWLVPPIVARAIDLAERMIGPFQSMLRDEERRLRESKTIEAKHAKRLAEISKSRKKLFLATHYSQQGPVAVMPGLTTVSQWLKDFCRHFQIRDGKGDVWDLTSHQFRRTFAYNYARSELGDLLYLKEHYGHWSLDMTMLYADGGADDYQIDNGLLDEVVRAKQERQAEILTSYLDSDKPLAKGEDWLGTWRPMVRTAKNKDELIQELSSTITLNGTGHSWCAGNAKGGNCGGLCLFEADMCVDCNMALIGPEHLPVWKEIAAQQIVVLQLPDMGVPAKSRANRILEKANQVINKLDGSRSEA
jgi:integrase